MDENIKMKFGQILLQLMSNISKSIFTLVSRLETSSRPFHGAKHLILYKLKNEASFFHVIKKFLNCILSTTFSKVIAEVIFLCITGSFTKNNTPPWVFSRF